MINTKVELGRWQDRDTIRLYSKSVLLHEIILFTSPTQLGIDCAPQKADSVRNLASDAGLYRSPVSIVNDKKEVYIGCASYNETSANGHFIFTLCKDSSDRGLVVRMRSDYTEFSNVSDLPVNREDLPEQLRALGEMLN